MKKNLLLFVLLFCLSFCSSVTKAQPYCTPPPGANGCSNGDEINTFILYGEGGTVINDHNTGCSTNGYDNRTAESVKLAQGTDYTILVSTGYTPFDNIFLWIDFDNNGTFNTFSEQVGTLYNVSPDGSLVTISIPATAAAGNHRMRATIVRDDDPTPCNSAGNDYTETHDYTVNIVTTLACPAPTGLTTTTPASITATTADLTWTPAGAATQWSVEYGPVGFAPGTGTHISVSTPTISLTGLTPSTSYFINVRTLCSGADSSAPASFVFTTPCAPVGVPYTQNFDGVTPPSLPACMSIENGNNAVTYWKTSSAYTAASGSNVIAYQHTFNFAANDWFFTPGINMTAGVAYQLTFKYRGDGVSEESLDVSAGPAANSASMNATPLFSNAVINNSTFQTVTVTYTAATTGAQYFGWHCYSGGFANYLLVDDINIAAGGTACPSPTNLTVTNITQTDADLNWTTVTGAAGYEYAVDNNPNPPIGGGLSVGGPFTTSGLVAGTVYYAHLRTDCGNGNFSPWVTTTFTTAGQPVCDTSATLTATNITQTGAVINWSAVTGAAGYEYVIDQTATAPSVAGTATTSTTHAAAGLTPNTTYYAHVRTNCGSGNFSSWKTIPFSTLPVGIKNITADKLSIEAFPNPVKNVVMIEVHGTPAGNATLSLTDITGRVIRTVQMSGNRTTLDMSSLAQGLYLIKYSDRDHSKQIKITRQ